MQKLSKPVFLSILFLIIFTSFSCNTTEPPPPPPPTPVVPKTIKLSLVETSCTEAFIKVEALTDTILPATVNLKKNNILLFSFTLAGQDTVIADTTLQINTSYTYQAVRVENGTESEDRSDTLTVKTLNTTSNNFTWQVFTFGEHSSSVLNDVAIIDENNIWAVGEIYMNDPNGNQDPRAYNVIHWNGSNWEMKKINDANDNVIAGIRGILYIGPNDIWLADGGIHHWNGVSPKADKSFDRISLIGGTENGQSINKLWSTSSNNIYGVGYNGMIAHYSNGYWKKIESGTSTNINDIWGVDSSLILATVSSRSHSGDIRLISISDSGVNDALNWSFSKLYGIWSESERDIYVVGDGVHQYKNYSWRTLNITGNFTTRVKGTAQNDIYVVGCCSTLLHFNGIDWYTETNVYGNFEGLDVKGNTITAVGYTSYKAILALGKRQ